MTEFDVACDRFASDLRAAGAQSADAERIRSLYAAALTERSDRRWRAFYVAVLGALANVEPRGPDARTAYGRLAALAGDDLGAALLTSDTAERMRSRLVEAA